MYTMQKMVTDFHSKYGLTQCGWNMMTADDWITRLRLIAEETAELHAAVDRDNLEDIVDAICDLLYVVMAVPAAMHMDIEPFFKEVHRSNMTKNGDMDSGKLTKGESFEPPNLEPLLINEGLIR